MKKHFVFNPQISNSSANNKRAKNTPSGTERIFSALLKLMVAVLLFGYTNAIMAQTLCTSVKQIDGVGKIEPRIFKDPTSANYFLTSRSGDSTFISGISAAGSLTWTYIIIFSNDYGTITDMIVDQVDNTLAGIMRGPNSDFIFKFDYTTATMNWIQKCQANYLLENIHQTGPTLDYIVTGEISGSQTFIAPVSRTSGVFGSLQNAGFGGEFYSAYDGTDIYGACRYYTNPVNLFNPALFRYDASTLNNIWTTTYVKNVATARIYPVAPIVDMTNLLQLSSGDDATFKTYLTGNTKVWLVETDRNGALAWTNEIKIPGYTRLNVKKIINTATGYYLLIDSYNGSIINYFFVVKTDKSGNVQWANRYGINNLNTVITGVEDNGNLYLTALSGSYNPGSNILLLKLDQNGMSDINCNFIQQVSATSAPYTLTTDHKPTNTNNIGIAENSYNTALARAKSTETVYCATNCAVPCNTLAGSLATGVLAFYPFGYGTLNDLSGNGNNLTNNTSAYPTADRNSNPTCAYHFDKINADSLFIPAVASGFLNGITTGPFSISLWYQPTGTRPIGDYELLAGRGSMPRHCPDTWGEWSVGLSDCRKAVVGFDMLSHWQGMGSYPDCNAALAGISNNWHHLAFVYDGMGTYQLYVDGFLDVNSHGPCGFMSANSGPFTLGKDYTGDLDDIIIYNRALTPAEVAALMALNGSCCDGTTSSNKPAETELFNSKGEVKIYPNPSSGEVFLSAETAIRSVAIYTSTGALAAHYTFDVKKATVDIGQLAPGIYLIKVITDSGSSIEKMIKE